MKILAIFTGGTISCSEKNGVLSPDGSNSFLLLKSRPDAEYETAVPYTVLSENTGLTELEKLFGTVYENLLGDYDGIIVAHGTDTLQFTAAFLAQKLGLCRTPVVMVSANYPLSDSRSNGFENFGAAVDFIASKQGRGVFVSYKNSGAEFAEIHRGGELLAHASYSDALSSLDGNVYGRVANGAFIPNKNYIERCNEAGNKNSLSGRVMWLRAHPGMIYPPLTGEVKAVLLEGYHSGTLNTDGNELRAFCASARKSDIPLYLTGCEEGFNYESKSMFESLNIIVLPKMPPVTAYIKLWLK